MDLLSAEWDAGGPAQVEDPPEEHENQRLAADILSGFRDLDRRPKADARRVRKPASSRKERVMDDHAGSSGSADSVACPPEELEEKVSKRRKAAKPSEAPVVLPLVPPPAPPLSAPVGLEPAGLASSSASASTSSSSSRAASSSSGAVASSSGAAASSSEQLGGRALDAGGDGGGADGGVPPSASSCSP